MSTATKKLSLSSLFSKDKDLTEGSISLGIIGFAVPMFLGQLLQQLYNIADAWVIGHFAGDREFAAVNSQGSLTFFIIGFFGGIATGGSVIISKYFGAKDKEKVSEAIHTNILFAIVSSILATIIGLLLAPTILQLMKTPDDVMPYSLAYLRIYFAGVSAVIFYNVSMSVMRALGDSIHPLIYLCISSITNMVLDLLFVAVLHLGVSGAAIATLISQFLSVFLCLRRLFTAKDYTRVELKKIKFNSGMMSEVIRQGLPMGIQNSVISIGNMTIQSNINSFGPSAMSGVGAYQKVEGFVFLPITAMSMALPTFISQNLGAKKYDRAKKGAAFGISVGVILAELFGFFLYSFSEPILKIFIDTPDSLYYGMIHSRITALFFCLLAFSHCAAGVMRGCGKSLVPMITMLAFWCAVRVTYVTVFIKIFPVYNTVSWAYPITWSLSSITFACFLIFSDWTHNFEKEK